MLYLSTTLVNEFTRSQAERCDMCAFAYIMTSHARQSAKCAHRQMRQTRQVTERDKQLVHIVGACTKIPTGP